MTKGAAARLAAIVILVGGFLLAAAGATAAPYAAYVMDARSGESLLESDADRKLHPASLTKMMTLYLVFEAVGDGRLSLDQRVTITRRAAAQPPSRIGLRAGQRVTIRDLIRAAAVKSANDAAVALAEAVDGTEAQFARRMNAKAKALGMVDSRFATASGLTAKGQYTTARDMAMMGRALFYDFPQYYNIFGRSSTNTMGRTVHSTNRRFLAAYRGADGIKTGYTNAAGYNLVSSAERNGERVIGVVLGGKSGAWRNARMAELLDTGFRKAPARAEVISTAALAARRGGSESDRIEIAAAPAPEPRPDELLVEGDTVEEEAEEPSLLAEAGELLVPAAAASEQPPLRFTQRSPRQSPAPRHRPGGIAVASAVPVAAPAPRGPADWSVQVGVFRDKESAVAELASAALGIRGLSSAGREVDRFSLRGRPAYRAKLTGLDRAEALSACAAIEAKGKDCLALVAR